MTSYDVGQAVLRRWWVLFVVMGATALIASTFSAAPVYWARYDLNLVAPDRSGEVYSRTSAPTGVTALAGILEVMLSGNHPEPQAAQQSAPIFGLRNRVGVQVLAKDKGFQWSRDYVAALSVQIAEPSDAQVNAEATALAERARATLATFQDQQGVPTDSRVTLEEPSALEVVETYPARTRATAAAVLLGGSLAVALAVGVDRWLLLRRRARARSRRSPNLVAARG